LLALICSATSKVRRIGTSRKPIGRRHPWEQPPYPEEFVLIVRNEGEPDMKVEQWKIGYADSTAALLQIGMNELYRRVIGHGVRDFASLPSFASFRWIACDFCVISKFVCVMVSLFASSAQFLSAPLCITLHRSPGKHDGHDANDANSEQPSPAQILRVRSRQVVQQKTVGSGVNPAPRELLTGVNVSGCSDNSFLF